MAAIDFSCGSNSETKIHTPQHVLRSYALITPSCQKGLHKTITFVT